MPDVLEFQQIQAEFSQHLRNPAANPAPSAIEDRRMQIYRRLFINNIANFLEQAFPVLHSIYPSQQWAALVRRFYAEHRCTKPQFYQVAEEFLEFLQQNEVPEAPAFMLELAHYEWVELALAIDPSPVATDLDEIPNDAELDLLETAPVLSPWHRVLSYEWPVHQIGPDYQPTEKPTEPTWLMVYRKPDEQVGFLQINLLTARLIEMLQDGRCTGRQALQELADEAALDRQQVEQFGDGILRDLLSRGAIVGVRQAPLVKV